jgi:hypothetical protein
VITLIQHGLAALFAGGLLLLLLKGWRRSLFMATVLGTVVVLSAAGGPEPEQSVALVVTGPGPSESRSAEMAGRDLMYPYLIDPEGPVLVVRRLYVEDGERCFEADSGGTDPDVIFTDCAAATDPADVQAYFDRQVVGRPMQGL